MFGGTFFEFTKLFDKADYLATGFRNLELCA